MSTRTPAAENPGHALPLPAGSAEAVADGPIDTEPLGSDHVDGTPEHTDLSPEAADLVRRLRRVQGQVGGLVRMVEAGRTSAEIITQLSAAEHALHRVGFLLVAEEMRNCARGGADDPEVTARIQAAEKLFLRLG